MKHFGIAVLLFVLPLAAMPQLVSINDAGEQSAKENSGASAVPATARSLKEYGAQCNLRRITGTIIRGSRSLTVKSADSYFTSDDTGRTLVVVGSVGGVPTAFEPTISYVGPYAATLSANAPFSAGPVAMELGTDDTAAIQTAVWHERGVIPGPGVGTPLIIPGVVLGGSGCLTHTIVWESLSIAGLQMGTSALVGFPGEDVLQAYDPSNPPAGIPNYGLGTNLTWRDFNIDVDQQIDATQPWNLVNAAGVTLSQTPYYRPIGAFSVWANDPLGPGWITGGSNGVASVSNGNATVTVAAGETAPSLGQVVVFPYTSPVFSSTVTAVSGQAVTLSAAYPGATSAQQEWFAGTAVQSLSANIGATDTTLPVTLAVTPSPLSEYNVAGHGLLQIDSEQISYYGVQWVSGFQILGLIRGVNGTTAAPHSAGAVLVPLNPFHPAAPWPVTPTVNSGATTPANAEYYPAYNVGNAGVSFPLSNGAKSNSPMSDSSISNVMVYGINSGGGGNSAGWFFQQYPYEDHFNFISAYNLEYGIAQGAPVNNHAYLAGQPTCNAATFYNTKIRSAHAAFLVCGGNATFSDWGVYNGSGSQTPSRANSSTGIAMLFGYDDQTGARSLGGAFDRFIRVYYESNFYNQSPEPTNELDDVASRYESDLFGAGYQWTAVGGDNNVLDQVEWQTQPGAPLVVWGSYNQVKNGLAINATGIGNNSFGGGSGAVSFGYGNTITANANGVGAEQVATAGSLAPAGVQKGDFLAAGAAANPFLDYLAGLILPQEMANERGIDPYPMNGPLAVDATAPVTGNKVSCTFTSGDFYGGQCVPRRFNGESYIGIGSGQRIISGQYAFYMPMEATAATTIGVQVAAYGTGCPGVLASQNVTFATPNTWQLLSIPLVDFTSTAGKGCVLQLLLNGAGPTTLPATISIAYMGFQPYIQNLFAQNVIDPKLHQGNCVEATAGGRLVTAPAPCGSGAGESTLTANGLFGNSSVFPAGQQVAVTIAAHAGHFTSLVSADISRGSSCTTAPVFNVFDGSIGRIGVPKAASAASQTIAGSVTSQPQTLTFAPGDVIGIYISAAGSGCSANVYNVSAQYSEP